MLKQLLRARKVMIKKVCFCSFINFILFKCHEKRCINYLLKNREKNQKKGEER